MIYSINPFALSRLTNAAHIAFMGSISYLIDYFNAEYLGVDDKTVKNFKDALHNEEDVVNKARKSNYTLRMNEADEQRNKYFRSIHYRLLLAMIQLSDDPNYSAVVPTIETHLVQQYPLSICNSRSQDKTAKIRGLLHDINSRISGILEMLNLKDDIAALKKANDDFEEHYMYRVQERVNNIDTATFRSATEDLYRKLCFQICYYANAEKSTDLEENLKSETCQDAVNNINQLIKDYKSKVKSGGTDEEEGLSPDPSAEREGSEMLNDSGEAISEPIRE